ncbi:MAG: hypothetical protein K0S45_645 [Nitrospira sp.]|jgi:hypothetical protein|nr:hypothetical protein [Nitrospira sp.]
MAVEAWLLLGRRLFDRDDNILIGIDFHRNNGDENLAKHFLDTFGGFQYHGGVFTTQVCIYFDCITGEGKQRERGWRSHFLLLARSLDFVV